MPELSERQIAYREKLRDPRWQKRRLDIFNRDDWKCRICGSADRSLNLHHLYYLKDVEPWEYPDRAFLTLCEMCHDYETEVLWDTIKRCVESLKHIGFTAPDFHCVSVVIESAIEDGAPGANHEQIREAIRKTLFPGMADKQEEKHTQTTGSAEAVADV